MAKSGRIGADDFIFNCYQLVAFISKLWELDPGDVIFTGTTQGVILGYRRKDGSG